MLRDEMKAAPVVGKARGGRDHFMELGNFGTEAKGESWGRML